MEEKLRKYRYFCAMLFMLTFLIVFILLFSGLNSRKIKNTEILKGWSVSVNEKTFDNVNLYSFQFPALQTNDIITLTNTLPEGAEDTYASSVLRLFVENSSVTVFVGGSKYYSYGTSRQQQGLTIGNGFHFIPLASDDYGTDFQIKLVANEPKAFTNISVPIIGDSQVIYTKNISDTFAGLCASIFLLIFGVCIIAISIFMMIYYQQHLQLLFAGLFSVCMGMWTFCNKGNIQLISDHYSLNLALQYFSLYLGSIPVLLFVKTIRQNDKKRFSTPNMLLTANMLLILLALLLHGLNLVHYPHFLPAFLVLDILVILYVILSCIRQMHRGNSQEKTLLAGASILALCSACDIIIFHVSKHVKGIPVKRMDFTALGAILFVMFMLIRYGNHVYQGIYSQLEKKALMSLAYSDNLTKLSNRAKFMEEIDEYEQSGQIYSIISFDLNNLKLTNDRLGHANGDLLLQVFGKMIHSTFTPFGTAARMGGDEFAILIPSHEEALLDKAMSIYENNLNNENAKGYPFRISAAWGIASNTEGGHLTFAEVFALADKRMYMTKSDMKKR